ncbi:MAG: hypothetical protein LUM44_19490 [Pyrinomonadaceae bacterium]|nr:hypothetical protein [Pyrinomonadaceae bacterium]
MKVINKVILAISVLVLGIAAIYGFSGLRKSTTPSQTVENYVAYATTANFSEIELLTISNPKFSEDEITSVENSKGNDPNKLYVIPRESPDHSAKLPQTPSEIYLGFVRKNFPKMISNANLRIKSIESEVIDDKKAKVSILMTNNNNFDAFAWTFLLLEKDDQWKIFDIIPSEE